ncbi:hypothetical protein RvY_12555-1 [Ramazzottius varieornatus]|uniref:Uncharacterized protein n=1 Tax=Ramazzottius varieornatus TaxID=947166 RepID=A0A1D1VLV7_RAMVA|nr:hypothetical protein RvY_12555-1 [Ramazzottius varieornatus]
MSEVRSTGRRKKKDTFKIFSARRSEPEVPKEKQKTILCKACSKFVARDGIKYHRTCQKHMQILAANPVQEDLTKLPATEANNTVKAAFEEALKHGDITENKTNKYFRPFLKRFCPGCGAIAVNHGSRVNKNKRVRPKISSENSKEFCNNSDESDDDDEEDNKPVELPVMSFECYCLAVRSEK